MTRMSKLLLTLVAATQGLQLHTGFVVPNSGLHATPLGVATLRSQLRQARENSNGVRAYLLCHLWSLWQPTIKNAPPPQVPLSNSVGLETEKTQPTEATLDWLQQYSRQLVRSRTTRVRDLQGVTSVLTNSSIEFAELF